MIAEDYKGKATAAFGACEYGKAVELYTKAIEMNPLSQNYYTNRCGCVWVWV